MVALEGNRFLCLVFGLCAYPFDPPPQTEFLKTIYEWSFLDYKYDSAKQRENDLKFGPWIPAISVPIDVDVYYNSADKRTVFVTSPRLKPGVPASVSTVVVNKKNLPQLKPYPSWEWHTDPALCKPDRIASAFRIKVDECDRLWVLDSGIIDTTFGVFCPPQILAFDLKTNKLVHRYEIPIDQYIKFSFLVNIAVEVRSIDNKCINTFLYLADATNSALLVYDVANKRSWQVKHLSMMGDPRYAIFKVEGDVFVELNNLVGLALSPARKNEPRKLFYSAMSSDKQNWVYTRDLRNETFITNSLVHPFVFHTYFGRRSSQSSAVAIDNDGVMFYGLISDCTIACFNTAGEFGQFSPNTDVVASHRETLQFPSGIKVVTAPNGDQELWLLTSRYQRINSRSNPLVDTEINFRIMTAKVEDMKKGTKCDDKPIPLINWY